MDLHPAPMRPGITPAGAGKRPNPQKREKIMEDHPRGCGEKASAPRGWSRCPGSPPRVRGKESLGTVEYDGLRITPAGAGKSLLSAHYNTPKKDHPRGYREKIRPQSISSRNTGSPPQMRGKVYFPNDECVQLRITPADAGKSSEAIASRSA